MYSPAKLARFCASFCIFFVAISHLTVSGQKLPRAGQISFFASPPSTEFADTRLMKLNVFPEYITLSGFSSGGTFAQQLQFAYSSLFSGIATFSHSYYRCGPGNGIQENYDNVCTTLGNFPRERLWNPNLALVDIESYFRQGLIENPSNLRNKRLYVFAGTQNALFTTDQTLAVLNVYEPYILNNRAIRTRVKAANLTLPSHSFGAPCAADSAPTFYVSNCDLPGAFESLHFLLGEAVLRYPKVKEAVPLQPLQTFDQTEFFYGSEERYEMDNLGFLYIPTACRTQRCLLHFYFHGCSAGREFVGPNHIINSGYLEVAELNNIIMVFPQVLRNNGQNQIGCWDTYGHTGRFYATQRGAQITALRNMLARILGEDEVLASLIPNGLVPVQNGLGHIPHPSRIPPIPPNGIVPVHNGIHPGPVSNHLGTSTSYAHHLRRYGKK